MDKISDKDLGLFINKKINIKIDYRLTSLDSVDNYLLAGDEKGKVYSYEINQNEFIVDHIQDVAKGKVEQIKCISQVNVVCVLISGVLYILSIPKLERIYKTDISNIYKFVINSHHNHQCDIAFITKKKIIKFQKYDHSMRKLIDTKYSEIVAKGLPDVLEWHKNWLSLIIKKEAMLVSTDGQYLKQDGEITYSKYINGSWLIYTNNIGIFMEQNMPKMQSTIDFGPKHLVCISSYKMYVLALQDSLLKIYDGTDSGFIQENIFHSSCVGRLIAVGNKNIFYVLQNIEDNTYQIWQIKELAYQKQITKLLKDDNIEEALGILNTNISSNDDNKPKNLELFFLDCAWSSLKKGFFKRTLQYVKMTNYNPINFLYMFKKELKINIKEKEILKLLEKSNCSIDYITEGSEKKLEDALSVMCNMLLDKRTYFIDNLDIPKALNHNKKMVFVRSDLAIIDLDNFDFYFESLFELINTSIVKIMVLNKFRSNKIFEIIDYEYFKFNKDDLKDFLVKEHTEEAKIAMAYIYERLEEWEEALKIWKDFGIKVNANLGYSKEACERTKSILKNSRDKQLFHDYIQWMIVKYSKEAFELFYKTDIINVEHFYSTIITIVDKENNNLNIKEKFLEYYLDSGTTNERYHTILCDLYIEKLYKIKKQDSEIDPNSLEGNLKLYYDKLEKLLKTSMFFNKTMILEKIKDSWLYDLEIYLYSQLHMHTDAINKLIAIGVNEDNFDKVEKYCTDVESNRLDLFGEMFKTLCGNYRSTVNALSSVKSDNDIYSLEKQAKIYKKQILNLLKKFGEDKLDPFMVIEQLPSDWAINEEGLYNYLVKTMKSYNHMSNKYKIARSLSEMSLLYKEKEVIDARNKSIMISNDTICELCRKKIGSTMFVVYPNMKVYHHKCPQSFNVCPTTRVDFSKQQIL